MGQKGFSLSAVLITIVAVAVILWTEPGPRLVERETLPLAVTVSELQTRDVQPWRLLTGRFEPVKTSELKFEVAGRVEARHVEAGTPVAAGEVLLKIDDRDYRDALTKTQAELDLVTAEVERDKQLLALARRNRKLQVKEVARLEELIKRSLVTRSSLDVARQKLINLQAEEARTVHLVSAAKARLDLTRSQRNRAKRDLGRTSLIAPFAGIVNQIGAEVGNYVGEGQVALKVVDVSRLDLLLHVGGKEASVLRVGELIEVEVPGIEASAVYFEGELVSLQVAPDPETFTYEALVRIRDGRLRAGMTARARLPQPRRDDVIMVPIAAVQYLDGRTYVFAEYDGTLKRTRVSLGARIGDSVIVEAGIEPGLRVIVHDVDELADGQKVVVRRGAESIH